MGQTRAKKTSKKAQKTVQRTEVMPDTSSISPVSEIEIRASNLHDQLSTSTSSSFLAPPSLSSRESRSSLPSSSSATSRTTRHDLDIYDPSCIEVKSTPNKGYALFAASHIPKGTIVLAERPTIRLTTEDEAMKDAADEILEEKLHQLPTRTQKYFKKLHNARKDGFTKLRSIYHSNCYNLDGSRSTFGGSCIGLTASRINHSCIPNVQFTFLETIPEQLLNTVQDNDVDAEGDVEELSSVDGIMVFRALRAISKGKEIVSNYETVYAIRSQRQLQLQLHYGFQCDCDACTVSSEFWAADDGRRQQMIRRRSRIDAIETRIVLKKEPISRGRELDTYFLRSKTFNDGDSESENLVPLSIGHCSDVMGTLNTLESLLVKEGLTGIELQRVCEEKIEWERRKLACHWATVWSG